ncbi:MAG TPA: site-2 protease family protein [Polyangiaceae bacterium]|jgi:membrane-associated protease RseP (regulator of RpoE activity)|nr:site-2 protease family protein [Polyangiaceae bacterium]
MSEQPRPYYPLEFPPPEARPRGVWVRQEEPEPAPVRRNWRVNAVLFVATVLSVIMTGAGWPPVSSFRDFSRATAAGWSFAVPLLAILLFHEFGHYIAARLHRVDASLPYFLPLPILSPFGTMGAVIAMRGRIRSRNALLDIGASGPLAGLLVAIPVLMIGLSLSTVGPIGSEHYVQEGQSLLYLALKRVVLGPIPAGYDVHLHPTAFAGWAGLLVTMLNLLPWGQLDGGHVAYALFGFRQDRMARVFRGALIPLFFYNLISFMWPVARGVSALGWVPAFFNSLFWLMWFIVLGIIGRASGGSEHPPTEPGVLSPGRRVVAAVTLIFFVLLFMPTPLANY